MPNDVRWVVNSNEYNVLCKQVYKMAANQLDHFLKRYKGNKPLAIVMDLDETVLDNSKYQIELYRNKETFNMNSWSKWVQREEAELVPGALKYINKIRKNNIQLIFINNRMHKRLDATKNNMKKLNVFSKNDIFLLRKNKEDKKHLRRQEIINFTGRMKKNKKFKIIQYVGDAMGDFPENSFENFGKSNFVIPNPMYGKW